MLRLERVRHTFFAVEGSGGRVLFDPVFGEAPAPDGSNRLLAVFISHSHADHFDPATLSFFSRDVPVFVPAATGNQGRWAMRGQLGSLGFRDVRALSDWEIVEVEDIRVTAVPAPRSLEGTYQMSFLIQVGSICIFHGVDAREDDDVAHRIARGWQVDFAILAVNCALMFGAVRNQMSPSTGAWVARILGARVVLPVGLAGPTSGDATDASWPFPYHDHDDVVGFMQQHVGSGQLCMTLPACHALVVSDDGGWRIEHGDFGAVTRDDPGVGRRALAALALLGSLEAAFHFELAASREYARWRGDWLDGKRHWHWGMAALESVVDGIDPEALGIPVATRFPRALRYVDSVHGRRRMLDIVGATMGACEAQVAESSFDAECVRIFEVVDREAHALAAIECRIADLVRHRSNTPRLPRGMTVRAARVASTAQRGRDMSRPDCIYPRVSPLLRPIRVPATVAHRIGLNVGDPLDVAVVPVLKVARGGMSVHVGVVALSRWEEFWLDAIDRCGGMVSATEIARQFGCRPAEFQRVVGRLCSRIPDVVVLHGIPGDAAPSAAREN